MSDLKNVMVGDYRNTLTYSEMVKRYGVSKMSPLIISCAITGAQHGAEANPNLPETAQAQAQSTYDAYNAGASLVHIHRRRPENLSLDTQRWEEYLEVNQLVRAKCPDIIINNTCIGGRLIDAENQTVSDLLNYSLKAKPEVSSIDITTTTARMKMKARKPPLSGRDEDYTKKFDYLLTDEDAVEILRQMRENGVKPEWEMYNITDIKRLHTMIAAGQAEGPHWVQMLFGGNGVQPCAQSLQLASELLPADSIFSVIAIGAAHAAISTMAIIMGHHIRVGLEDEVYYAPHQLATSNAQLVERAVRIAKELGRPIATPAQAREMLGLGAPRAY